MKEKSKKTKTICIDFDGVIHDYSRGYQGKDVFDKAIDGASNGTKVLKENGWRIIIYTTRPNTQKLRDWLKENDIAYDYINESPDQPEESSGCKLIADVYLDDRAVNFRGNWKWTMGDIAGFKPWGSGGEDELKDMRKQYRNIFEMAKEADCSF